MGLGGTMTDTHAPPDIDFETLASEDDDHFKSYRIFAADYVLIAVFAMLFGVVFLQFFTRYILNDSVSWTEEAARYLLILLSFAGAIRCQVMGSNIALEFVDKYYGRAITFVHLFALAATIVLFAVLAWSALELIQRTAFQNMVSLPFPKYYLYATVMGLVLVNLCVMAAQLARRTLAIKAS